MHHQIILSRSPRPPSPHTIFRPVHLPSSIFNCKEVEVFAPHYCSHSMSSVKGSSGDWKLRSFGVKDVDVATLGNLCVDIVLNVPKLPPASFEDLKDYMDKLSSSRPDKFSGVLGLFNCQGGGWCPLSRRNKNAAGFSLPINCIATPKDIEWSNGRYPISLKGVTTFAVYMFKRKELKNMELSEEIQIMLQPITYELITVSPVTILPEKSIQFSAIGLVNVLNSSGAIQYQEFDENLARIGVKGHGEMKTFASEKPKGYRIDGDDVEFGYDEEMVTVEVVWPNSSKVRGIEYLF